MMELGFNTPMAKAKIIDEAPIHDAFGIGDAKLIAPGDPKRSVLYHRITKRGEGQMPPTSTNVVDAKAAELISEWIRSLKARQPGD